MLLKQAPILKLFRRVAKLPKICRGQRQENEGGNSYKSSLHVWRPGVSWQATHEDDAAPVEPDHGGQELSQAPDLTHQVDLHIFLQNLIKYLSRSSSGLLGFPT